MKKRNELLGSIFTILLLMGACAQPEQEFIIETQSNSEIRNGTEQTELGPMDESADNDIYIKETYGEGDYTFKIDAHIHIPSSSVQLGTLSTKNIDIEVVEKYLCAGENLIEGVETYEYISEKKTLDNDLAYDIEFSSIPESPGSILYSNWRLDRYYSGGNFELKAYDQCDSKDKKFIEDMKKKTVELFDNLGIETTLSGADLAKKIEGSDAEDNCYIEMISMLDGFRLISSLSSDYIRSYCHIGERGVNGLQLNGIFQVNDGKEVSVLSLEDVLVAVKKGVEEKNINTYEETINRIELSYMIDFTNQEVNFYPVWSFSTDLEVIGKNTPLLCINAQTGSVVYMSQ